MLDALCKDLLQDDVFPMPYADVVSRVCKKAEKDFAVEYEKYTSLSNLRRKGTSSSVQQQQHHQQQQKPTAVSPPSSPPPHHLLCALSGRLLPGAKSGAGWLAG